MVRGSITTLEGHMRLSEEKIFRIAERLHDELAARGLLIYKDDPEVPPIRARSNRIKAITTFIESDLRIEDDIDLEAERVLETYSRTLKPVERDVLKKKHKEDIARRRNYRLG